MKNSIIYLIGFPGTGKRTIAEELLKQAPLLLVDNHYINNVVLALLEGDGQRDFSPEVWDRIREVRSIVLRTIRELSPRQSSFVFTNDLWENCSRSRDHFEEVATTAHSRAARFLPVRLLISEEELARRVAAPERATLHKLRDVERVIKEAREHTVYRPKSGVYFDLNVTNLSAAVAAESIADEYSRRFRA